MRCQRNELISLDVSNNAALEDLFCQENKLTSLDVSSAIVLELLDCSRNQLDSLDISNNIALQTVFLNDMPSLKKVCVWELPFPQGGLDVYTTNSPNVYFTMDCN